MYHKVLTGGARVHHTVTKRGYMKLFTFTRMKQSYLLSKFPATATHLGEHSFSTTVTNPETSATELKLSSFTDTSSLLGFFGQNVELFERQPSLLIDVLENTTALHYSSLNYPWLQPVSTVAHLQIQLMNKSHEVMSPIRTNRNYNILLERILHHHQAFDNLDSVRCLNNLILLFEENEGVNIHVSLKECLSRLPQFDLQCLAQYGLASRELPKGIFLQSLHTTLKRYSQLMPATGEELPLSELEHFVDTFRNIHLYISRDLLVQSTSTLLSVIQKHVDEIDDPGSVSKISYIARRLYHADMNMAYQDIKGHIQKIVELVAQAALRILDNLDARNLAEISSSLKLTHKYGIDMSEPFVERSLKLLQEDSSLADVINLMRTLNSKTDPNIKRRFEAALYPKMTEVDSLSLANMAEAFYQMEMDNRDVLFRFEQLVIQNGSALCQAISHLYFVTKYLLTHKYLQSGHHRREIANILLTNMRQNQNVKSFLLPTIAHFCLQSVQGRVPDFLFGEVIRSIPKWRINSLKTVLVDLSDNRQIDQRQLQLILTEIQHQIYKQVTEKPQVINNIQQLTQLVHAMALHVYYRDHELTDKLMSMYLRFIDQLNPSRLFQVTKIFLILKYYQPEVLDELVNVLLAGDMKYPLNAWTQVLEASATVGFTPTKMSAFTEGLFHHLDLAWRAEGSGNMKQQTPALLQELSSMKWLTMLQYFPEDRLSQIFSLDFIEKVDDFLEANPLKQQEIEETMMILNRNVILECPQLDIPWFHEVYCRKHYSPRETASYYKREILCDALYDCLTEALGGPQYVKQDSTTPYYYYLDFECILNKKKKPVAYSSTGNKDDSELQRVAILPFIELDYCYYSKRLKNIEQVKLRHLQIMGYKVVQIPFFSWYSMGLTEQESKVDFLRERIFGDVS